MEPTYDQNTYLLMQILPLLIWQFIFAVIVFVVARKRGVNPWIWTIATLIPGIGMVIYLVFSLLTWLSILDRLNALEGKPRSY